MHVDGLYLFKNLSIDLQRAIQVALLPMGQAKVLIDDAPLLVAEFALACAAQYFQRLFEVLAAHQHKAIGSQRIGRSAALFIRFFIKRKRFILQAEHMHCVTKLCQKISLCHNSYAFLLHFAARRVRLCVSSLSSAGSIVRPSARSV